MSERHPPDPIERHVFDTSRLVRDHPPRWRDRNKQVVYEIACPTGSTREGQLEYSRWPAMPLPASVDVRSASSRCADRPGFYDYVSTHDRAGVMEWHVNFADPHVFCAYGSALFAQDEMQVAEHPVLGSLREALLARKAVALTVEHGRPTPVLIMGAERCASVATDSNATEGRPAGLYGNAFARANPSAVARATTRIDPPTITNIIAMAAPSGGRGRYQIDDIERVLTTAFTAFRAAVMESTRSRGLDGAAVVHSGFWGCGAFGGHRVLMTVLQILAAEMAGVEQIVLHTGDPAGSASIRDARRLLETELVVESPATPVSELIRRIEALGFEWGMSDGN